MSSQHASDDTKSVAELRDKFSGWTVYTLYGAVITYAMATTAGVMLVQTPEMPVVFYNVVFSFAGVFGLITPVAMWKDISRVREHTSWSPGRYRYVIGSFFIGLLGLLVIIFYLVIRRDVVASRIEQVESESTETADQKSDYSEVSR